MTTVTKKKVTNANVADKSSEGAKVQSESSSLRAVIDILLCTAAIYSCYLVYGILHERMTRQSYGHAPEHQEKFTYTLFLTTIQCFGNGLWAVLLIFLQALRQGSSQTASDSVFTRAYNIVFDNVPKHKYALVSFSYFAAMASSTASLKFVSYPIQALAKSSKLIPVMFGRILRGHKYSPREYGHVLLITGGIALFFFKDGGAGKASSLFGIGLLAFSLIMDAVTGPTQETIAHTYKPSVMAMTFWVNFFPCIAMGAYVTATGELAAALAFIGRHPVLGWELALYCLLSAVGQSIIVWAVFKYNSMTVTIITTTRKFFTILASVLWFGNALAPVQWVGVALVFAGIGADSQLKYARAGAKKKAE